MMRLVISQNPPEKNIFTIKNIHSKIDFMGHLIKMVLFKLIKMILGHVQQVYTNHECYWNYSFRRT